MLNEIFTSTTLHDARFLGTKLLTKVMRLDALCVYVTFVDELASLGEQVVSMMSTIVPDNPAERTYKVVRKPADGLAYALALAEKYGLTYERLRDRVALMKAYLLYQDQDFDFGADLPPGHEDLIQDLELTTLLQAMAAGDKFLFEVSTKVLLACLDDPDAIRYRQRVLADCLAQPEVIRQMYAVATAAPWRTSGTSGEATAAPTRLPRPTSPARSAHLGGLRGPPQATAADRRRPCREVPLRRAERRCSPRCSASWTTSTSRRSATT